MISKPNVWGNILWTATITERMDTEKVYDYLNRLKSITHYTNSVAVAEYVYEYNDANQRAHLDIHSVSLWNPSPRPASQSGHQNNLFWLPFWEREREIIAGSSRVSKISLSASFTNVT